MTDRYPVRGRTLIAATALLLAACSTADEPPLFPPPVNVGSAPSSPGLGTGDQAGVRSGFDSDLTNWLGGQLGFTPVPVTVLAENREFDLQRGRVSLVIATYSITDKRREKVGFVGPYMLTQQGIMVRSADRGSYNSIADLHPRTVCTTAGSTSEKQLKEALGFAVTTVQKKVNSECMTELHSGRVDVVSTDQLLLYGIQKTDKGVFVPPDIVFGNQERYGIGIAKGPREREQCEAIRKKLLEFITSDQWGTFFRNNLPEVPLDGHKPDANRLDPC